MSARAAELCAREALLGRAIEAGARTGALTGAVDVGTVAGQPQATLEDYASARALVARLADDGAPAGAWLDLDPDVPQLAFHLGEELAALPADPDPVALARSLTFLKRHLVALRARYVDGVHEQLPADRRALALGLARLARARYDERFAAAYAELGHRRPYVDKFLRDHGAAGVPDGLLAELARVAAEDAYDRYLCVLKGGLTYALVLELLGVDPARILHVLCGRASGSHIAPDYAFRPLDFGLGDLRDRSVLVIENNVATGRTLAELGARLGPARPARLDLWLDHVLEDVAGLTAGTMRARETFGAVRCGPYPAPAGGAEDVRARLLAALASAGPSAPPRAHARRRSAAGAPR